MSEIVNVNSGKTFITGESVTAAKLNLQVDGATVTVERGNPTGVMQPYLGITEPAGWVLANGQSVGNASSNGTRRANTDTVDLFTLLWDASLASNNLTVFESGGAIATRGASAAIDYANDYAIALPNTAGRAVLGVEQSGGAPNSGLIPTRDDVVQLFQNMGNEGGQITLEASNLPLFTQKFTTGLPATRSQITSAYPSLGTLSLDTGFDFDSGTADYQEFGTIRGGDTPTSADSSVTTQLDNNSGNVGPNQGVIQPSILTSYIIKL